VTTAFADESYHEASSGGFYVLAAAVFDPVSHDLARTAMCEIRGTRNTNKRHWYEMDAQQRSEAAKIVAGLNGIHVVTIGTPVPHKRQERARAKCLQRLVLELYDLGVTELLIESRNRRLDQRDVNTITGVRHSLSKGARFHLSHVSGSDEPLLWVADIVAGSVRANRQGQSSYWLDLKDRIREVEVATCC
jgi:hypothetical protein